EPAVDQPYVEAPRQDPYDDFLRNFDTNGKRVTELEGELNSARAEMHGVRAEMHRKAEIQAFEKYAKVLQSKLPEYCTPDHARNALLAAAAQDPSLEAAFRYRSLTDADRLAADAELKQLEVLHQQVQQAPPDPRRQTTLQQIERRAQELQLALNSLPMLLRVTREIETKAKAFRPIDPLVSADREMVAAAIRDGGAGKAMPPDPPAQLGNMGKAEYRDHVRKSYGFDPGV